MCTLRNLVALFAPLAVAFGLTACEDSEARTTVFFSVENRTTEEVTVKYQTYDALTEEQYAAETVVPAGGFASINVYVVQGEGVFQIPVYKGDQSRIYEVPAQNQYLLVQESDFH